MNIAVSIEDMFENMPSVAASHSVVQKAICSDDSKYKEKSRSKVEDDQSIMVATP